MDILELLFNTSKYRRTMQGGQWAKNMLMHLMLTFEHELIHAICFLFPKGNFQRNSGGPIRSKVFNKVKYEKETFHSKTFMSILNNVFKHTHFKGFIDKFKDPVWNHHILTPTSSMTPPSFEDYYKCKVCGEEKQKIWNGVSNLCKQCLIQDNEYVCRDYCHKHTLDTRIENATNKITKFHYPWTDYNKKQITIPLEFKTINPIENLRTIKNKKIYCPNGKRHNWVYEKKKTQCTDCRRFTNIWCTNSGCCGLCHGLKPQTKKQTQTRKKIQTRKKTNMQTKTNKKTKTKKKISTKKTQIYKPNQRQIKTQRRREKKTQKNTNTNT